MKPRRGDVLAGRWTLGDLLGEGGFAWVYSARDTSDGSLVAIKILKFDAGDGHSDDTRARFKREVEALRSVRSPHVVRVFGSGSFEGRLFAVFEYVPGKDLRTVLSSEDTLPPKLVAHLMRQALEGLRAVHAAGMLHRDIKPENLRIHTEDGDPWRLKLLDFGIARPRGLVAEKLTATGQLIGTPRYMAPEQLVELPVTSATDLYSLGLVMFEMLAGSAAMQGGEWGHQLERLSQDYRFESRTEQDAPALYAVMHAMTERDHERRVRTADEALALLNRRPASRRKVTAALVGVGAITLASALLAMQPSQQPPLREDALPPNLSRPTTTPAPRAASRNAVAEDGPCGAHAPPPGSQQLKWSEGLEKFEVLAYLPEGGHSEQRPVVVMFHEGHSTPESIFDETNLQEFADRRGVVLVALNGKARATTPWDEPGIMPRAFRVVSGLSNAACIDPKRVVLLGDGTGGSGATALNCEIDAHAMILTNYRTDGKIACATRLPATLLIESTKNEMKPANGGLPKIERCGGYPLLSIDDYTQLFVEPMECGASHEAPELGPDCVEYSCEPALSRCTNDGGQHWGDYKPERYATDACHAGTTNFPYAEVVERFLERTALFEDVDSDVGEPRE